MRRTNLPGHALRGEGKPYVRGDEEPWVRGYQHIGHGLCECGKASPPLDSDSQRKKWHAKHKNAIRELRLARSAR